MEGDNYNWSEQISIYAIEIKKRNQIELIEFKGLKRHTHKDRTEIINNLVVPKLKEILGDNLLAIGAQGSYARDEDTDFSDIELVIFVKSNENLPKGFGLAIDAFLFLPHKQ